MEMKLVAASAAAALLSLAGGEGVASPRCAKIADDAERLACYDLQHRKTAEIDDVDQWLVRIETSRIDDSRNVFLTTLSSNEERGRFGEAVTAGLVIACRENVTSLYIHFGGHFMADSGAHGQVTYRIDDAAARTRRFQESNDNEALGLWRGREAIPFVKSLFGGEMLLVRATPFSESALTFDFPIAGLEAAAAPLREACNW